MAGSEPNRWEGLPTVTIHYAQTLDGRIATRQGQSQWISGEASLLLAHRLRASHAAVLVGVGTVVADNPRLTVRLVPGGSPLRVVADSTLRLPPTANVLTDGAARTVIATTDRAPEARVAEMRGLGTEVLVVGRDAEGRVDLGKLLAKLLEMDVTSVLVEGGRGIITTALRERLVQRAIICIAPKILGAGVEAVGDLSICRLADALTFAEASFTPLGEDLIFDGWLDRASGAETT
jgi:diaminohydroxyphosphoribosylaminopyrimidine deaminase / 5-amino-6-(5-phosphoribosylamino)uracil reductase